MSIHTACSGYCKEQKEQIFSNNFKINLESNQSESKKFQRTKPVVSFKYLSSFKILNA